VSQTAPQDYERIIAKLREENAAHRTKLSTYEKAEADRQAAALSDVEKATKRAAEAEARIQQYQQQLAAAHVKLAAQAMGIIDPDLAALAIAGQLQFGDDGLPTNVDALLKELVKQKAYLVAAKPAETPQTPAQTGSTPAAPNIPAMNPGRTNIAQPGAQPTDPRRMPRLGDITFKR
jgi:hypothetical protein